MGLGEWCVYYEFDNDQGMDCIGWCSASYPDRVATIGLSQYWISKPTKSIINDTARHEVLEMLVAPVWYMVNARYIDVDSANAERHAVIRRIENYMAAVEK